MFAGELVAQVQDTTGLPPAGFGTLFQDDITVSLDVGAVRLRMTPLDEGIIRLLAPDSYAALRGIRTSQTATLAATAGRLGVAGGPAFLVSVFGREDQARFDPTDVTLVSRNRYFQPVAIAPLTPTWGANTLNQRETASAIYIFEPGIALLEPILVRYGGAVTDRWQRIVEVLERERSRVLSRSRND